MIITGTTYRDKSITVITPTRGMIAGEVYASHMQMIWPTGSRRELVVLVGLEVADAYEKGVEAVLEHTKSNYIITLEDDVMPPPDLVPRLLKRIDETVFAGVSACYCTKVDGWPILLGDPDLDNQNLVQRIYLPESLIEVNAIPMGAAIWKTDTFVQMEKPWFQTTVNRSQDTYFCLNARKKGFRFTVDTSITCGHRDARTGKVY